MPLGLMGNEIHLFVWAEWMSVCGFERNCVFMRQSIYKTKLKTKSSSDSFFSEN